MEMAEYKGIDNATFEDLCLNSIIRADTIDYLKAIGKQAGLKGFEQVKNIYLEPSPFLSKGILTNTMKIQRHLAKTVYKKEIEGLYKEGILK